MELIGDLCDRFGEDRLFTLAELPGVTLHTPKALVSKGFLSFTLFNGIMYYQLIKRMGGES